MTRIETSSKHTCFLETVICIDVASENTLNRIFKTRIIDQSPIAIYHIKKVWVVGFGKCFVFMSYMAFASCGVPVSYFPPCCFKQYFFAENMNMPLSMQFLKTKFAGSWVFQRLNYAYFYFVLIMLKLLCLLKSVILLCTIARWIHFQDPLYLWCCRPHHHNTCTIGHKKEINC